MSTKRNKREDILQTNQKLEDKNTTLVSNNNWLGHSMKCAIVDHLLLQGATKKELITESGRTKKSVEDHLYHLKREHGLEISETDDIFQFQVIPLS